jgi:hypothetical protein
MRVKAGVYIHKQEDVSYYKAVKNMGMVVDWNEVTLCWFCRLITI